jgi:RNA polymerase sigma-70 factor (ECF subfamily)
MGTPQPAITCTSNATQPGKSHPARSRFRWTAPMTAQPPAGGPAATEADADDSRPNTLGDLLYANRAARGHPEQEWADLVRAIAEGRHDALHALYGRSHRIAFTLIMRITGNRETAEEVTLDVFHDVWRRAREYDAASGSVLGWIMNQARSRAIDRLRYEGRRKRRVPNFVDSATTESVSDEQGAALDRERAAARLRQAVARLQPGERRAIEAAFFGGLSYAEVAERDELPVGTVKTRIRSALQKLRSELGPEEERP